MDACIEAEGDHQLQAVHGVPRRVLQRRRPDPARHAAGAATTARLIMMHAENGIAIDVLVAQALAPRRDRPDRPRPDPAAGAGGRGDPPGDHAGRGRRRLPAVHRAPVRRGRRWRRSPRPATPGRTCSPRPARSTCTCPSRTARPAPDFEGAKCVCSHAAAAQAEPPGRDLWQGLRTNDLSVVSTDHCPFCFKDQKELGRGDFSKIPNGIARRRAPDGPAAPGRGRRASCAWPAGWRSRHHPGPDVRPVPAQGRDRPGLRRRHRALRPAGATQTLSRRPTT